MRHFDSLREYCLLSSELGSVYHDAAQRMGISDSVLNILYTIVTFGPCSQSRICRLSGLSRQTVNSAVRKMEREELIVLKKEGRSLTLSLTEKGQALARRTAVPLLRAEQAIFDNWQEEDVQALLTLTRRYTDDLKKNISKEDSL